MGDAEEMNSQNERSYPKPMYFDLLSEEDRSAYVLLQAALSAPSCKNRRNHCIETFKKIVTAIKAFVVQDDKDDWRRALVCGICWLNGDDEIAINTRQLRLLTSKCKSSINGSFQLIGYGSAPPRTETSSSLLKHFPFLKDNFAELRQWTIRQKNGYTKSQKEATIKIDPKEDYISPAPEIGVLSENTNQCAELRIDNDYTIPTYDFQSDQKQEMFNDFIIANDPMDIFNDPLSFAPNQFQNSSESNNYFDESFIFDEMFGND
ncbi:potassium/sodium hyperpolarization-activated cyclic nucleotide-gated channel 1 [Histomonas meleagridis]|uniref:potassium/sodium hyperpolarization-activated cyclic nucleotide-gated channel 1 n=1 Tax=Histomonas meleagridis TaxID=135588 RepID=UPI00355A517F|nr:potassium/sodium hyperpolarization-activated cyclic nucleotide-gated channel 1 [Histomonas meleagridis]KAH0802507.1 potassium/sodium hyperpolarization-activated cyclic nucleotide-gated channel 1 [Histomonas meleagridis]